MSYDFSFLNNENDFIKDLFNSSGSDTEIERLKTVFQTFLKNSPNGPFYFVNLLKHFIHIRPKQVELAHQLLEYVFSVFPEIVEITPHNLDKYSKEPDDFKEMMSIILKEDVDALVSFAATTQLFHQFCYVTYSVLDYCCLFGSLKCFNHFYSNNSKITEKTLRFAIAGGNKEIIDILKESGYTFEKYLETSIEYHRYEITHWLLENYKCDPVLLPSCIKYYNFDAFLYFLEHGHSLDETLRSSPNTCSNHASSIGDLQLVQYLIEIEPDGESKDKDKNTSLYYASENGHLPIVQYLIEKGADINSRYCCIKTPLTVASEKGFLPIVQYLLERGPDLDAKDYMKRGALHYACNYNHFKVVQCLVQKCCDLEIRQEQERTPLHLACEEGNLQIVQCLVENGADIEAEDENSYTPLLLACENGHVSVVEYLIEKGADIHATNYFGETALFLASKRGDLPTVKYLVLTRHMDIEKSDHVQQTPLFIAVEMKRTEVVKFLASKGANIHAKSRYGRSPYDIAGSEMKEILTNPPPVSSELVEIEPSNNEEATCCLIG